MPRKEPRGIPERRLKIESEKTVRLPTTADEIICATLRSRDDSALETLSRQFIRHEDLHFIIVTIEERLGVYLERVEPSATKDKPSPTPSHYAETLAQALQNWSAVDTETKDYLRRLQSYIIGELNPQIRALRTGIIATMQRQPWLKHDHHWQELTTAVGLYRAFSVGNINSEAVGSFFKVLQALHSYDDSFPTLDYTEASMPEHKSLDWVAEIDPFDKDNPEIKTYWSDRLVIEQRRGRVATMPELIHRRSDTLVYELERRAKVEPVQSSTEPTPEEQKNLNVLESYKFLAEWIQECAAGLTADMTDKELQAWRISLHFAHGSAEQVTTLLNAAAMVKEQDPQFFLEMMGVTPGLTYSHTAHRSHYFGSIFHLAAFRSMQLVLPSNDGGKEFKRRVQNLLEFDVHLPPLLHFSDEYMRVMEANWSVPLRDQLETAGTLTSIEIIAHTIPFLAALLPGYRLRKGLEETLRHVSVEEFDRTCRELPTASPIHFNYLIRYLDESLLHDNSIRRITADRLHFREGPECFDRADEAITALRTHHWEEISPDYEPLLWQSSPDRLLTSDTFFYFLRRIGETVRSFDIDEYENRRGYVTYRNKTEQIHHPDPEKADRIVQQKKKKNLSQR